MADKQSIVIVGGTAGIGRHLAQKLAKRGDEVVITGRDSARAQVIATEIGGRTRGIGFDLAEPAKIAGRLANIDIGKVDCLVLTAIERDNNTAREFDVGRAVHLVTLKLVGYVETVHALAPRLTKNASIILFGGQARERPYPGSTTVTIVNGGVTSMVRTLALELAPIRVNAIHPGIVGDSPALKGKDELLKIGIARNPTKRLVTMDDCIGGVMFLMENQAVNGINLVVDAGWSIV
jgi:NAD(P)-dependent dehydrogenase (short-subunit alcohol dehydrogenase family)